MWLAALFTILSAFAVSPDAVQARLQAVESLRGQRLAPGPPAISMSESRRAAEGAIVTGIQQVEGSSAGKGYGVAVLDVPIATLWSAINDETRHPGWTAVGYAELLQGRKCQSGRKVLQSLDIPWVGGRWWIGMPRANTEIMRSSGGSVRELAFKSTTDPSLVTSASGKAIVQGATPIGFSQGAWFLVALDERHTYVEYHVWTDPGGRVPARLATMFASKGVRETIEAIRRFAKEGSPSCPIE